MGLEKRVIAELEEKGVYDVYFCKGALYVINDWDMDFVQSFIDQNYPGVDVVAIAPQDDLSPYLTVNS